MAIIKQVEVLTDICINGNQSTIRKKALYGFHKDVNQSFNIKQKDLKGYGLLDAARFNLKQKKKENLGLQFL